MPLSRQREIAIPTYPADLQTVGDHTRLDVAIGGDFITKPDSATYIQMQALTQNIRYTQDVSLATITHGFQLAAAAIPILISVPNNGISIFEEAAGAIVQYQFFR